MKLAIQMHPSHPPGSDIRAGIEWDLQVLRWADEYGISEAWIGEHFTIGWDPNPCPEILISLALRETKQIVMAPGAHLLPYHNPIALAHRIAYLDHVAQGRYILGIGAGAYASDAQLFATYTETNHQMTLEAIEIMTKIWKADGPFKFEGDFWTVDYPEFDPLLQGPYLKPFQKPHPPIAMAGLSPNSPSLRQAGEFGFLPLSLNLSPRYLAGHWDAYSEGANKSGIAISRQDWRVGSECFVADTDEEALRQATSSSIGMGRAFREFLLPLFRRFGMDKHLVSDPNMPTSDITIDYLAKNVWLVGSPDTVAEKLYAKHEEAGGFGYALCVCYDHSEDPEPFHRSLQLMGQEVLPRVNDLIGE